MRLRDDRGAAIEPRTTQIVLDGRTIGVSFRRSLRARRIILRIARDAEGIVLTVPRGTSRHAALAFATGQAGWIWSRLALRAERVPFDDGVLVPLRGEPHRIRHRAGARGTVWREPAPDGVPLLCVAGEAAHLGRRVGDWLRLQARHELAAASQAYAAAMGLAYRRLAIRDPASRWGSCSASGTLSYSWRLILAPAEVLDYVAAHEIAHLQEMNHGPAFWALVRANCPHADAGRRWLKRHGAGLHRYGA
jgi:predicted metal-dependent hydrolase